MKGLGEGPSPGKERRKWAAVPPPIQPLFPAPAGPPIPGLGTKMEPVETRARRSEEVGSPRFISFPCLTPLLPLVLFFENISCLFLNPWLVSQDYSASPLLVTLSAHSQGLRWRREAGREALLPAGWAGLGIPGALTHCQMTPVPCELSQNCQNSWFPTPSSIVTHWMMMMIAAANI